MAIIKSSTNGTTWTTATVTGTGSTTWATSTVHSLAYANGVWMAGNNANQVAISTSTNTFSLPQLPDPANTATTWNTVTSNFGTNIQKVAYANGVWIAHSFAEMRRSTNGSTWTTVNSNFGSTSMSHMAYGNDKWIVVAFNGTAARSSTDGTTWSPSPSVPGNCNGLAYGNGVWIAATNFGTPGGKVGISNNGGASWTSVATPWTPTPNNLPYNTLAIGYGNGVWIAGSQYGLMKISNNNGSTWSNVTSNFSFSQQTQVRAIAYGNGIWVATATPGEIRTSTNGTTWTTATSNLSGDDPQALGYGNGVWMVGVTVFSTNRGAMRKSTNGTTWTTVNSSFGGTAITSINFGGDTWVAGGYSGQIRVSPQAYSQLSLSNTQISSFNTSFMAISNNRPRSSTDGITWTTLSGFESVHVNRFVEQNGKHMLLGNSGALYEKNTSTTTWTTRSTGIADNFINGAIYNNAGTLSYILRGNNAMYYSTNLVSWTTISSLAASAVNDIIGKP